MGDFTDDPAFRALLVIGLLGILAYSTLGHAIAYYEDTIVNIYGGDSTVFDDGFVFGHLHSMVNSTVTAIAALAMPLITSIRRRLKTGLAIILGLSLTLWNISYIYAATATTFFTSTPTVDAFETAKTNALNWWGIPLSWIATVVGLILFITFLYDLARRKPKA